MFWFRNETINYMVRTHNYSPDTCHCKLIFTYRFVQNKFLIVGHPEPEKKNSVGIFEYILASMLKVYLDVF